MTDRKPASAEDFVPGRASIAELKQAVQACQGCDLYRAATQAVFGEGPARARIVFVGEQPGDQEDRRGRPFTGPAGRLFDRALAEAGLDRSDAYVTNAVKHFKWEPRGQQRLHKKPSAREIAACRPWIEAELGRIQPQLIVCLGASAAQSVLGRVVQIRQERSMFFDHASGAEITITYHPSALLRARDEAAREARYGEFLDDLRAARKRLRELRCPKQR